MKAGFNLFYVFQNRLKMLKYMAHNCKGSKKELIIEDSFEIH